MSQTIETLHIRSLRPGARKGVVIAGNLQVACTLGRTGRAWRKREGDGATPRGSWPMRHVLVRPGVRVRTLLPTRLIKRDDGWCDEPHDRNYNRAVKLPYGAGHEAMWRDDELYDVCVVLDHNYRRRCRGLGSAVFFHLADPEDRPTAGCIGVSRKDMTKLLALCGPKTKVKVW